MKAMPIKSYIFVFISSFLFGYGLEWSGMTNPAKIVGFLDIFGNWDPSLAFVMIGAIGVHAISFRFIVKRDKPICETEFGIPTNKTIDRKLVLGAGLFGIGWATGGLCPGPALASMFRGQADIFILGFSIIMGMLSYNNLFLKK